MLSSMPSTSILRASTDSTPSCASSCSNVLASTAQTAMQQPDLLWADEIVVADSGSTDRTAEIAESLGARDLLAALRHAHSPVELKNL